VWHEKVYNRVEWKKLLRTARNRIRHMPMEWMNECFVMKVTRFCYRFMSLHHAHPYLSFFLSFLRSFLPTNFPSFSLPSRSHLPFSLPHPPHEPNSICNPRGLLHLLFFPPS
jgi:hypothetical protein